MKQKVVIRLSMTDEKSRKKAFKTVVGHSGVESTAVKGKEKDQIEVVGVGIDAVELTSLLRKNVGYAELFSVSPVGDEKDGDKKDGDKKEITSTQPPLIWSTPPYPYNGVPHHYVEFRDPNYDNNCIIM